MVLGLGIVGLAKTISKWKNSDKQQGSITNPSNENKTYNITGNEDAESIAEKVKAGGDVIINYIYESDDSGITNTTTHEESNPSSLIGKSQAESGTGDLLSSDQQPTSLIGRSTSTDTGGGDYTSKEGLNTNLLLIVGGIVLLGIFVLPLFMGGKK